MKGVILDLGSDGSFPQFPYTGAIDGVYGPMKRVEASRFMRRRVATSWQTRRTNGLSGNATFSAVPSAGPGLFSFP